MTSVELTKLQKLKLPLIKESNGDIINAMLRSNDINETIKWYRNQTTTALMYCIELLHCTKGVDRHEISFIARQLIDYPGCNVASNATRYLRQLIFQKYSE